ncbi:MULTISPECIES: YgiQ family radical SAM protein [Bacteroides]|uniref:YgiQ family radical SAM protein n=1 Tax=Bacteroides TaxID=816 RepID=UPI001D2ACF8F|nr:MULTISPECIES: YgiQ family radical SAM protein [Bacteroides]HJD92738.1 YgiQ family radical SAM protein [Bacteroides coprosuis]
MRKQDLKDWLPTTKKEVKLRGWDELDIIFFSGDAYVDHPSFGAAVLGRVLEAEGLKVAIVPQPNWRDDLRDFKKLGKPRLFFAVSAGCMDSMVNKYTANKRLRSEDAYTPDGRPDMRPEYPTIVYSTILRELYPDSPIVIGSIEASMRRLTHYDYWEDRVRKSILCDSKADLLIYGMGELPIVDLAKQIEEKLNQNPEQSYATRDMIDGSAMLQSAYITNNYETLPDDIELYSHEECLQDKKKQASNFKHIEVQSNSYEANRIIQKVDGRTVVVNPPYPPMTEEQLDRSFDLPYMRMPHPKYKNKRIPAYEMIKFSVNLHRGCFGGCSFCTISAHQGKFIANRSKKSIINEVKEIIQHPEFKGYLSDLGGPSANMYKMHGKDLEICKKCKRPSCIHPKVCPNLNTDHSALLDIYRTVDALPGIKKSFVSSGVRYDLLLHESKDKKVNKINREYTRELIEKHVSGRLKIAPEHTSDSVLSIMRKPSFSQFYEFKKIFDQVNRETGLRQQLIPYFISSHPGCREEDMAELAVKTKQLDFHLEQVQDFTPTPMTVATEAWYTGYHPYTLEPVYSAKTKEQKLAQRQFFFWYQPKAKASIIRELKKIKREDLIDKLY